MIPPVEGNITPPVFFSPGGATEVPQNIQIILRLDIPSFLEKLQDPQAMPSPDRLHKHKKFHHFKQEQLLARMLAQLTTVAAQAIQNLQTQKTPEQQPDMGKQKNPETQRDEVKPKGKEAVGEDLVNIQVFAGEKGSKKESQSGTQENFMSKTEKKSESKEKEQANISKELQSSASGKSESSRIIPKETQQKDLSQGAEKPKSEKNIENEISPKSSSAVPENRTIESQSKEPVVIQSARIMSDDLNDKPGRAIEKEKEKEKVESVQREDKFQSNEHPRAHRVVEHGRAELRHRDDAQQQATPGEGHHHMLDADIVIPIFSGWYLPSFLQDQEHAQGKSKSKKFLKEMQEQNLGNILFMIFTATQEGAKTIQEVIEFIESRSKWFIGILGLRKGLPSRQLIWWILAVLDPNMFDAIVAPWLLELQGKSTGKAVLPFISVWETPIGLLFGQTHKGEESVDNVAVPQLLKALDLKQAIVMTQTIDPLAKPKEHIERKGGDFIIEIEESSGEIYKTYESYIEGQERIIVQVLKGEPKTVKVILETPALAGEHAQMRYYTTNIERVEHMIFDMLRVQAPVENKVDWLLNVAFQLTSFDAAMKQCHENLAKIYKL